MATASDNGVSVSGLGVTGVTVQKQNAPVPAGYSAYQTYDIEAVGFSEGNDATVTITLDSSFDANRPVFIIDHEKETSQLCEIVGGKVTFNTNHFSLYSVAQVDDTGITVKGNLETYTERVTSLQEGVPYVITSYDYDWVLSNETAHTGLVLKAEALATTAHRWYIKGGYLVYGSATSTNYMGMEWDGTHFPNNYYTTVGVNSDYPDLQKMITVADTNGSTFGIRRNSVINGYGDGAYNSETYHLYLNRLGGGENDKTAAGWHYGGSGSGATNDSSWYFNRVYENAPVTMTINGAKDTIYMGSNLNLTTAVTNSGNAAANYDINWSYSNSSVATVSANGVVTPKANGHTYITATLTAVDGHALQSPVSVRLSITVATRTTDNTGVTVTTNPRIARLYDGELAGGKPYMITNYRNGWVLTNIAREVDNTAEPTDRGLYLKPIEEVGFDHLWYYETDRGYLSYNQDGGTDRLSISGNIITVWNTDADKSFTNIYRNEDEKTYTIGLSEDYSGSEHRYLNQLGGSGWKTAYVWSDPGDKDEGSKWYFYELVTDETVALKVSPSSANIYAGNQQSMNHSLTVNGVSTSNYELEWYSSDPSIATVKNGIVTGLKNGNVTITAAVTWVEGEFTEGMTVEIPIQIIGVETISISGKEATIAQRSGANAPTNVSMTVRFADGTTKTIPVTLSMLTDAAGNRVSAYTADTYKPLTVTYAGETVCTDFQLMVVERMMIGEYGELKYIDRQSVITNSDAYKAAVDADKTLKVWEYLQRVPADIEKHLFDGDYTIITGSYGELAIQDKSAGIVQYELNTMQIDEEDTFAYAVDYAGPLGTHGYYYSTLTVVPATTIYYEDSFEGSSNMDSNIEYKVFDFKTDEDVTGSTDARYKDYQWVTDGTLDEPVQGQDRPGEYSFPELDANNIYGYDPTYTAFGTYSGGQATRLKVNKDVYATATFTFWGTGFNVISMTSKDTGTILVDVYKYDEYNPYRTGETTAIPAPEESHFVDLYYGYRYAKCEVTYEYIYDHATNAYIWDKYVGDETKAEESTPSYPAEPELGDTVTSVEYCWIPAPDDAYSADNDCIYQVPAMKVNGLPYDKYTAVITVSYKAGMDHNPGDDCYYFYLDAIRIYDPANDGKTEATRDAYLADGEGWPEYFELRNLIISKNDFNSNASGTGSGVVFIDNTYDDSNELTYTIEDYMNYGPNNEVYLAPGQALAFKLDVDHPDLAQIHLAMKKVDADVKVKVYDAEDPTKTSVTPASIQTSTDLYYDISCLNGKTVVIQNTNTSGAAILSITNIKVTYTREHVDSLDSGYCTVSQAVAETALLSLRETVPEEPAVPEPTIPEETVPETTVPEEQENPRLFEPEKFDVRLSESNVKEGSKVTVTVTTGKDVESITVNGAKVTKYTGSWYNGTRIWQARVEAEKAGQMDITVICYNSEDLASLPVVKRVEVAKEYTSLKNLVENLIIGFFGRIWGNG